MNGGYANGYGNGDSIALYNQNNNSNEHDTEGYQDVRTRNRRPGGYGGFSGTTEAHVRGEVNNNGIRPHQPGRGVVNGRREDRTWDSRLNRSGQEGNQAVKQVEDSLRYLQEEWSFMTEDKCIPAQVALQILDESSLGLARRYDEFLAAQQQLQSALKGIVNEHHQGFNSSIGTFHQIQSSIQSSHRRVKMLRESLIEAKSNLSTTRPEYQSLAIASQNYADMLEVIDLIKQIQQIPEKLEAKISEKRFLTAVDCLQDASRLIQRPILDNIGALSDLKIYFSNQEHLLTDILTEELHNHLYLKSPYSEHRWLAHSKLHNSGDATTNASALNTRSLDGFLSHLETSNPLVADASPNPEADSFRYIHMIVEALSKLGCVQDVVNSIEQRLPIELFKIVQLTNSEVKQRHSNIYRGDQKSLLNTPDFSSGHDARAAVLNDLLDTLYARFEAVAELHRVFHDVIVQLCKREAIGNSSNMTGGFKELCKLYQSEVRSLLHDYLATDTDAVQRLGQGSSADGHIFHYQRDKTKKCAFQMDFVDSESSEMKHDREDTVGTWQKFVPGLVTLSHTGQGVNGVSVLGQKDGSSKGHKMVVEPSVFNIKPLLLPSLSFLNRLRTLVPPGSDIVVSTLTSFLNDFLVNVFRPQLEETLSDYCSQSYTQVDAFQQDPDWASKFQNPIFSGTTRFLNTIVAFCRLLDDLTHDQIFSQLILTQMNTYYDRCQGWYKALVAHAQARPDGRQLKASAAFAGSVELVQVVDAMRQRDSAGAQELVDQENALLISMTANNPLEESHLMSDQPTQHALCLLYSSVIWLAKRLKQLRHISDRAIDTSGIDESEMPKLQQSLTHALPNRPMDLRDAVYLPLSTGTASIFDGIVNAFQGLGNLVLRTLHFEIRCQIIHGLSHSFTGSFIYNEPVETADENILELLTRLMEFRQEIRTCLQPPEVDFITQGSSRLADLVFVQSAMNNIKALNALGSAYMQLNASVLYHNLLNIEAQSDLPRAFTYFKWFDKGPDAIITAARRGELTFGYKELKVLLEWWYSEATLSPNPDEVATGKKSLDEKLLQLSQSMWQK